MHTTPTRSIVPLPSLLAIRRPISLLLRLERLLGRLPPGLLGHHPLWLPTRSSPPDLLRLLIHALLLLRLLLLLPSSLLRLLPAGLLRLEARVVAGEDVRFPGVLVRALGERPAERGRVEWLRELCGADIER